MRKDIHPEDREVLVHDLSSGFEWITRSSQVLKETKEFKGKDYPLLKVEISSKSHPFFTGKSQLVDTAGRIDKFKKRYAKKK